MTSRRVRVATTGAPARATGLSLAVVLLALAAVAAVTVLHVLRDDVDPLRQMMSEYANGRLGVVMTVAFHATGLAAVALAVRAGRALDRSPLVLTVRWCLGLGGAGLVVAGIWEVGRPLDPESTAEAVHSAASIAAFCLVVAAMAVFPVACRLDERWRSFRPLAVVLAATAAGLAVLSPLSSSTSWGGLVQRALGLTVVAWLLLTALRIRANARLAR